MQDNQGGDCDRSEREPCLPCGYGLQQGARVAWIRPAMDTGDGGAAIGADRRVAHGAVVRAGGAAAGGQQRALTLKSAGEGRTRKPREYSQKNHGGQSLHANSVPHEPDASPTI